ncbi:carbohydrate ABC transporter permease [Candidatus Margulisiibacteriota bacterium]
MQNNKLILKILFVFGLITVILFSLFPVIYMIIISTSKSHIINEYTYTLENFYAVLTSKSLYFLRYLGNSLLISTISALMILVLASFAAYALARLKIIGKFFILFFVLMISMFPQISIIGYLFKFMSVLGWIDTYLALISSYTAWILPFAIWLLTSYFSQLPRELDDAAIVDGAKPLQILIRIILPIAKPALFSTFLLSFVLAFNEFMFALILTTSKNAATIPVGIALFQGLHGELPWGKIMAAATLASLPIILIIIIYQKHIISGLTKGAIK